MWTLEDEQTLREDLIEKIISKANEGDGMLCRAELGSFTYAGQTIRVIDSQGGIWNPGASWTLGEELRATLSINTTKSGKYEDQEVSGGLWRYKDACAMYRDIARPMGIEKNKGLHQLRHTFVSTLIQLGVNAKQIQKWVGHESILETMDIYGHLFPNSLNELSRKLDDYVDEQLVDPRKQRMLA